MEWICMASISLVIKYVCNPHFGYLISSTKRLVGKIQQQKTRVSDFEGASMTNCVDPTKNTKPLKFHSCCPSFQVYQQYHRTTQAQRQQRDKENGENTHGQTLVLSEAQQEIYGIGVLLHCICCVQNNKFSKGLI